MDYKKKFRELLKRHVELGILRDPKFQQILEEIPLEYLLDEGQLKRFVLYDRPAVFYYRDDRNARTMSAPHMISMTLSMLELNEYDNVLIMGSKGGLIESAIAKVVDEVYIIEEHEEVATITEEAFIKLGMKNIWIERGNPFHGIKGQRKFTKILITGAVPFLPNSILQQLEPKGIIVFPMIVSEMNHQIIFQMIKKKKNKYKIINFGSVIFSYLYTQNLPDVNISEDFTIKNLIEYNKNHPDEKIFKEKPFFEEYKHLPNIKTYQVLFKSNDKIYKTIQHEKNLTDQKPIKDYLIIAIENFENKQVRTNLFLSSTEIKQQVKISDISLEPGYENYISVPIRYLLKESNIKYDITLLSVSSYRLDNGKMILHILKNSQNWDLSIEF